MTDITLEQRARELLAAEYAKRGYPSYEKLALSGNGEFTLCSIRAIEAALRLRGLKP
jgi:hypothetical protein